MITEIGETVTVGVVFGEEREISPKWFLWQGRKYSIQRVAFRWRVREGRNQIHHFSVTDGATLFELCYDPSGPDWRLMATSPLT